MKKKWLIAASSSLLAAAALAGCSQEGEENTANGQLSVVASFYPMYEFTKQVAGDRADVSLMVSSGEDAHHYEPSAKDMAGINEADVFVYSSEEMEHWAGSLLDTVENDKLVVARAADGLEIGTQGQEGSGDQEGVTILGAVHHYHTGDEIKLRAKMEEDVAFEDWHWFTRENADEEWAAAPDQKGPDFILEAAEESFEVQAVLYDDAHNEYAKSQPLEIVVDNHESGSSHGEEGSHEDGHGHGEAANTMEIAGLAGHYHTGDVVTLIAKSGDAATTGYWHWYIRSSQEDEWEVVEGQETDRFEYETTGESFEVRAVRYDGEQQMLAESEPVSVLIDNHENQDPHSWLDPLLAQAQVNVIRDALIEADPDGQTVYEKNAEAFNKELQSLHEEYETALRDAKNRVFVVQHQAFGYLAERYDLEQAAIGGISTEVEPSPSRIAEIGNLVNEYNVPVIYYQQGADSAIAETVAAETATETAVLYDLEVLSEELETENLGYLDAMHDNLEALQISIK